MERERYLRKEHQQDQLNFQRKQIWYEKQNEVIEKTASYLQELGRYSELIAQCFI